MFLLKQIERSLCSVVTVAFQSLHRHDIEAEFRFAHVLRRVQARGASTCTIPRLPFHSFRLAVGVAVLERASGQRALLHSRDYQFCQVPSVLPVLLQDERW